jgi:hypothetical protein
MCDTIVTGGGDGGGGRSDTVTFVKKGVVKIFPKTHSHHVVLYLAPEDQHAVTREQKNEHLPSCGSILAEIDVHCGFRRTMEKSRLY